MPNLFHSSIAAPTTASAFLKACLSKMPRSNFSLPSASCPERLRGPIRQTLPKAPRMSALGVVNPRRTNCSSFRALELRCGAGGKVPLSTGRRETPHRRMIINFFASSSPQNVHSKVIIVLMPCRRRKGQRGVERLPPTASKRVHQTSLGSDNRHTRPFSPLPPLSCYASPKHAGVPTWTGFARLRTRPIRLVARSRWRWQPVPLRFGSASQRIVQRTSAWLVTRSSQLHLARSRLKLR